MMGGTAPRLLGRELSHIEIGHERTKELGP